MYLASKDKMVGYTVSKKVARAVDRNKIKRRLRAIFRAEQGRLKEGFYLLVAKQNAGSAEFTKLTADIRKSLALFRPES
jgi:ribonuclease P protein component